MWSAKIITRSVKATQRSAEWFAARHSLLTSSEVASALSSNRFESSDDLLKKKISPNAQFTGTLATSWGEKYEPIAKQVFSSDKSLAITDVGLVPSETIPWLGASPDGLVSDGRLIEIKCPFYRHVVAGVIPHHYWIQMQIQLEVCDVEECYFMQCVFEENKLNFLGIPSSGIPHTGTHPDGTEWYLSNYTLDIVKRDRDWFKKVYPALASFWTKVERARSNTNQSITSTAIDLTKGNPLLNPSIDELPIDVPVLFPLVSRSDNLETEQLVIPEPIVQLEPTSHPTIDWSEWVSPSDVRNYLLRDPLLDWLNLYGKTLVTTNTEYNKVLRAYELDFKNSTTWLHYLLKTGNEFENAVIAHCKKRFPGSLVTIAESHQARDPCTAGKTLDAMKAGTPFIYHGLLHDPCSKTYGIADLIVRSDYVNKLFVTPVMSATDAKHGCTLSNKWHYVIVDIKHSMLSLRANGIHLLNSGQATAYKGQVYIYNNILAKLTGYKPAAAYILGRRWSYTTKGERFDGNGWFDRAGVVDFTKVDSDIPKLVSDACNWVRKVRTEGSKWSILPPSNLNLYPNMCNEQDTPWHSFKKVLADSIGEITNLWQCGIGNREIAFSNGIKSWRDSRCNAESVGIRGPKQGPCLDAIIDINKPGSTNKILPVQISEDLPRRKIEFYLDFETSNDVSGPIDPNIPYTTSESFIYMVGLGWTVSPSYDWNYVCLVADSVSADAEKEIFLAMHDKIFEVLETHNALADYTIYHWSNAERVIYESTEIKYYADLELYREHFNPVWCDLCELFRQEPIVVAGAMNFSLKSVAPAMYKHGFINTIWDENGVTDGLNAMVKAIECSEDSKRKGFVMSEHPIMKGIVKYNEVDCRVMMEILEYIRANLTSESLVAKSVVKSRLVGKRKQLAVAAGEETRFVHETHNTKRHKPATDSVDSVEEPAAVPTEEPEDIQPVSSKKRRRVVLDD